METQLYEFEGSKNGELPQAGLLADGTGTFYGTTAAGPELYGPGTVFRLVPSRSGYTEHTLHRCRGYPYDGSAPSGALIEDNSGSLYGTTFAGGAFGGGNGNGTVFKLSRAEGRYTESVLYSFKGGRDGIGPRAALVADGSGALYGTTSSGGINNNGTVFQLSRERRGYVERIVYRFVGGNDGNAPYGDLIIGADGAFYGTTTSGGDSSVCASGCGTIFKLSPFKGRYIESVIYRFHGGHDGAVPFSGLTAGSQGIFFGTTYEGGISACVSGAPACGYGTAFELTSAGSGYAERVLHRFRGGADAQQPQADLLLSTNGTLFGTSAFGGLTGCYDGCGTVFALTPLQRRYSESVLYSFQYGADGAVPLGALIEDSTGALYGTTGYGGTSCRPSGCGTVFKLLPGQVPTDSTAQRW